MGLRDGSMQAIAALMTTVAEQRGNMMADEISHYRRRAFSRGLRSGSGQNKGLGSDSEAFLCFRFLNNEYPECNKC